MLPAHLARAARALALAAVIVPVAAVPAVQRDVRLVADLPRQSGGCTMRDGPGDGGRNCINVIHTGRMVNEAHGYLEATRSPGFPATDCTATVEMWGQLDSGARWRISRPAHQCSAMSQGAHARDINKVFKPGSTICSRTQWEGKWSDPACVPAPK